MNAGRPNLLSEDEGYRSVKEFLDLNTVHFSRKSIGRAQNVIYGFCLEKVRERIRESAAYFEDQPFISIQADSWTSQSNFNVYGISVSFYDVIQKQPVTVVLYCAPLEEGKAADKLEKIISSVIAQMNIEKGHIIQSISDAEGCVTNSFNQAFPDSPHYTCLAHELQTCMKHALGLQKYKEDACVEGEEFFDKLRTLVAHFTISPLRTSKLLRYQEKDHVKEMKALVETELLTTEKRRKFFVGMTKFSTTRWSAAYKVCLRLLRLKKHIDQYFYDEEIDDVNLNSEEWAALKQIAVLLSPFSTITTLLQHKEKSIAGARYLFLATLRHNLDLLKKGKSLTIKGEEGVQIKSSITKKLPKLMLERLDIYFNHYFGDFLDEVERTSAPKKGKKKESMLNEKEFRLNACAMYLDPRIRSWMWEKGNLYCQSRLRDACDSMLPPRKEAPTSENRSETARVEINTPIIRRSTRLSPQKQPEASTTDKMFDFGRTERRKKKKKVTSTDRLLNEYEMVPLGCEINNVFDCFLEKESSSSKKRKREGKAKAVLNPYTWWTETEERHPNLEPLAKLARRVLPTEQGSIFSEQQFSHAKRVTSGTRARTGVKALNSRQFVKYNMPLMKTDFSSALETLEKKSGQYLKAVRDLPDAIKTSIELPPTDDIEEESLLEEEAFIVERECIFCENELLKVLNTADYKKVIYCDAPDCSRKEKGLKRGTEFLGCTSCRKCDICLACHARD